MSSFGDRLKKGFPFRREVVLQTGTVSGPAAIQALESALEPIAGAKNRYEAYREFLRMDPEANNAVMRLALLVQYAYKGIYIKTGKALSNDEKILQENAQKAAHELDLRGRFFYIARHLIRDGDEVFVAHIEDDVGVKQIQPLPMSKTTAVESQQQIGDLTAQIFGDKFFVLNESSTDKRKTFPENEHQKVYHVSIDNYGEEIRDLLGRYTFGVWSESPLENLRSRILWKHAILITDILWRYRNIPREVHEIDVSHIRPEQFAGKSAEERLTAYQTAVQNYLKEYAKSVQKKKVDQGYIIVKGNKIYYTEPKRIAYTSPNELVEQINESIREGLGLKSGRGTYATELVSASYVILLPDMLAYKIKRALLDLLKLHLIKKYKANIDELDKLDIRLSLVLDILRGELVRQIAVLAASGTHTPDELRSILGDEPLTNEQIQRLTQIIGKGRRGQFAQQLLDLLATATRQIEPTEPITPESRRTKQTT